MLHKKRNTDAIIAKAKAKTKNTEEKVLLVIDEMLKNGEEISFYRVYKTAGVSKSFVYNNSEIRAIVERLRKNSIKKNQGNNVKDVIINTQKRKIRELEKIIREYEKAETFKEKYEKILKENCELKKQLEKAYKY